MKNAGLEGIKVLATNKTQSLFAVGDKNSKVMLLKNLPSPKIYREIMVSSEIIRLDFSPKNDYLAVISLDKVYIYDLRDLSKRYEMYRGFSKAKGVTLANDWSKVYIPDSVGEIRVFDQGFLTSKKSFYEKISECDDVIKGMEEPDSDLLEYIREIESKFAKQDSEKTWKK